MNEPRSADDERLCQRCGGRLQVKLYSFDLDLPTVYLCLLCIWGPDGILVPTPQSDGADRPDVKQ